MQLCHSEHTSGFWYSVIWPCSLTVRERMSHGPCSVVSQITKRHTNTTRFWRQEGIYAPPLNILSVSSSLLSCRSKGQAGRKLREQTTTTASQLYSKSPVRHRSETQGQQCAHGPCSHPLWKRCLSPVPRNISKRKRSQLYEGWQSIVCGCDSCEAAWTVW